MLRGADRPAQRRGHLRSGDRRIERTPRKPRRPRTQKGLAFFIESDELWETLENRYNIRRRDSPKIRERPHENLWRRERGDEEAAKIAACIDLFELVDHSTGNPWLDTYNCCHYGDVYAFDEEIILELAKAFAEAKELLERMTLLNEIIEARPHGAMLDLIRLWNTGELRAE